MPHAASVVIGTRYVSVIFGVVARPGDIVPSVNHPCFSEPAAAAYAGTVSHSLSKATSSLDWRACAQDSSIARPSAAGCGSTEEPAARGITRRRLPPHRPRPHDGSAHRESDTAETW